MKGLDNNLFLVLLIISNAFAILQLAAAVNWPRLARLSFFLLFTWASWTNWSTALHTPQFYLDYADLTWSSTYTNFIRGWFSHHIPECVGFIASCQILIALSLLFGGRIFRIGATGAIIFLLAIIPFGVGSGFPCTLIMALALFILLMKKQKDPIWEKTRRASGISQDAIAMPEKRRSEKVM